MADQTVTLRLSPALLAQVDAFREQLMLQTPGAKLSRSDAVRVLLVRALKTENEQDQKQEQEKR